MTKCLWRGTRCSVPLTVGPCWNVEMNREQSSCSHSRALKGRPLCTLVRQFDRSRFSCPFITLISHSEKWREKDSVSSHYCGWLSRLRSSFSASFSLFPYLAISSLVHSVPAQGTLVIVAATRRVSSNVSKVKGSAHARFSPLSPSLSPAHRTCVV